LLDFCVGRREAGEILGYAAEEREFVGGGIGVEVVFFKPGEDERVDGGFDPGGVVDGGNARGRNGLERPPFFLGVGKGAGVRRKER
jgi:hypothetical protein